MTVERRQALVERLFAEADQRGQPLEGDPRFRAWVDQWAAFEIDVDELKRRYGELLKERSEERRLKREARLAQFEKPAAATQGVEPAPEANSEVANSIEAVLLGLDKDADDPSGRLTVPTPMSKS